MRTEIHGILVSLGTPTGSTQPRALVHCTEAQIKAVEHACMMQEVVVITAGEFDQLAFAARWRVEHLTVESWWKKIDEAVRKHPECRLGESVSARALELITERDEFKKRAEHAESEWQAQAALVKEACGRNSTICFETTKVVAERDALAAQVAVLREAIQSKRQSLDRHGPNCRFEGEGQINESFVEELEAILASTPATASAELAALREDKARLDWMEKSSCEEGRTMAMPRYSFRVPQWEGAPGPSIRAAIDAARSAAPQEDKA